MEGQTLLHDYRIGTRLGVGFGIILLAAGASFAAIVAVALQRQERVLSTEKGVDGRVRAVNAMIVSQRDRIRRWPVDALAFNEIHAASQVAEQYRLVLTEGMP